MLFHKNDWGLSGYDMESLFVVEPCIFRNVFIEIHPSRYILLLQIRKRECV